MKRRTWNSSAHSYRGKRNSRAQRTASKIHRGLKTKPLSPEARQLLLA